MAPFITLRVLSTYMYVATMFLLFSTCSIWSMATNLYDDVTKFWDFNSVNISGMIAIDDNLYRLVDNVVIVTTLRGEIITHTCVQGLAY